MDNLDARLARCFAGRHEFQEVDRYEPANEATVIRWCRVCGAIVCDKEYDGRLQPGKVFKVTLPAEAERERQVHRGVPAEQEWRGGQV